MKFLCDVHIPYRLVSYLTSSGFYSIHINGVLERWYTKDSDICSYADSQGLILVSKDSDFRSSYFVHRTPKKLIKVNLGNISNRELVDIFSKQIPVLAKLNEQKNFLFELDKSNSTWLILD